MDDPKEDQLKLLMKFMKWVSDENVKVHRERTEEVARIFLKMEPKQYSKKVNGGGYKGPSDTFVAGQIKRGF